MKNMQYDHYLWPNRRNCLILQEIGVEEHDGDVKFLLTTRLIATFNRGPTIRQIAQDVFLVVVGLVVVVFLWLLLLSIKLSRQHTGQHCWPSKRR